MTLEPSIEPLAIGPIQLPSAAVLAPLAGYTDLSYRLICRRLGAAYAATEVTLDTSINLSEKLRRRLIQITPEDHPIAGQIMGREADSVATAARHLVSMGCDVIDLNFACPARKALRRHRGGHQLRLEIVRQVLCRLLTARRGLVARRDREREERFARRRGQAHAQLSGSEADR